MTPPKVRAERLKAARLLGQHTRAEWLALVEAANGKCSRCLLPCTRLTKDHIVPISKGGSDAIDNIRPVCRSCNAARGPVTHADTVAEEIRRVRDLRGETTAQFARHFMKSARTIEDWEQGRRHPNKLEQRRIGLLRTYANRGRPNRYLDWV